MYVCSHTTTVYKNGNPSWEVGEVYVVCTLPVLEPSLHGSSPPDRVRPKHSSHLPPPFAKDSPSVKDASLHLPSWSLPHHSNGTTLPLTITRTISSWPPSVVGETASHSIFSTTTLPANGTVLLAAYPAISSVLITSSFLSTGVCSKSLSAKKMAVISLSWLKSAYTFLPSGNVAGSLSSV